MGLPTNTINSYYVSPRYPWAEIALPRSIDRALYLGIESFTSCYLGETAAADSSFNGCGEWQSDLRGVPATGQLRSNRLPSVKFYAEAVKAKCARPF